MTSSPDDPNRATNHGDPNINPTTEKTTENSQKKQENSDKTNEKNEKTNKNPKNNGDNEETHQNGTSNTTPSASSTSHEKNSSSYAHAASGSAKPMLKFKNIKERDNYYFDMANLAAPVRDQYAFEQEKMKTAGQMFTPVAIHAAQQKSLTKDLIQKAFEAEQKAETDKTFKSEFDFSKSEKLYTDEEKRYLAIKDYRLAMTSDKGHIFMGANFTGINITPSLAAELVRIGDKWIEALQFTYEDIMFKLQKPIAHAEGTLLVLQVNYQKHSYTSPAEVATLVEQHHNLTRISQLYPFEANERFYGIHFLATLQGDTSPPNIGVRNSLFIKVLNTSKKCSACNSINHFRNECDVYCTHCGKHGHYLRECRSKNRQTSSTAGPQQAQNSSSFRNNFARPQNIFAEQPGFNFGPTSHNFAQPKPAAPSDSDGFSPSKTSTRRIFRKAKANDKSSQQQTNPFENIAPTEEPEDDFDQHTPSEDESFIAKNPSPKKQKTSTSSPSRQDERANLAKERDDISSQITEDLINEYSSSQTINNSSSASPTAFAPSSPAPSSTANPTFSASTTPSQTPAANNNASASPTPTNGTTNLDLKDTDKMRFEQAPDSQQLDPEPEPNNNIEFLSQEDSQRPQVNNDYQDILGSQGSQIFADSQEATPLSSQMSQ